MYISVGRIVKPQGIKGEVKIHALTDDIARFSKLKVLYIDERPYKIASMRMDGSFVFVKFFGVDDRNAAELLRDKFVRIDRVNAVELGECEFFVVDLVGATVTTKSGEELGKISAVDKFGAADVVTVKGDKNFSFPFLKRVIANFDAEEKVLVVTDSLKEVAVYED